jgi:hypothetical protein
MVLPELRRSLRSRPATLLLLDDDLHDLHDTLAKLLRAFSDHDSRALIAYWNSRFHHRTTWPPCKDHPPKVAHPRRPATRAYFRDHVCVRRQLEQVLESYLPGLLHWYYWRGSSLLSDQVRTLEFDIFTFKD